MDYETGWESLISGQRLPAAQLTFPVLEIASWRGTTVLGGGPTGTTQLALPAGEIAGTAHVCNRFRMTDLSGRLRFVVGGYPSLQ